MRDVSEMLVTQIRIYPSDNIPYLELSSGVNTAKIVEQFQFKTFQTEGFVHHFSNGALLTKAGPIIIVAASVDPRRITLQAKGSSADADAIQFAFWKLLNTFGGHDLSDEPLIKSEETMCAASLDIDFSELISPALYQYLSDSGKPRVSTQVAEARSIELQRVAFTIKYKQNQDLEERGISLANKVIAIEPRAGTATSERRFFTLSPTDSLTHLALLEELERGILAQR